MKANDIEEIKNIRRMAERGLKIALSPTKQSEYVDIFQHIIDTAEALTLRE